jgi:putative membrane protein
MMLFIVRLVLNALALMLVAYLVPGVGVSGFGIAVIAALVIGLVNALIRPLVEILSLPVTILTLGLFSLIINAAMFALAAWFVPGFELGGFGPAFWGALLYTVFAWLVSSFVGGND